MVDARQREDWMHTARLMQHLAECHGAKRPKFETFYPFSVPKRKKNLLPFADLKAALKPKWQSRSRPRRTTSSTDS